MDNFPFLTVYDPPGSSEGAIDPLGLYLIAEHLASQLVPSVRERMQRVRLLTAIAVGSLVVDGLDDDPRSPDASPYLVWEWLLIEAFTRTQKNEDGIVGVPGTLVASRAIEQHGYLDARSYLKTARIFGFHGVYKRLAHHLGIINVNLGLGQTTQHLANAWARGLGYSDVRSARAKLVQWSNAVRSSLQAKPFPRTNTNFKTSDWDALASAFMPSDFSIEERDALRNLLLSPNDRPLGSLPAIWELQAKFTNDDYCEEALHEALASAAPQFGSLLTAIKTYERFARKLQDAFDILRAEASTKDSLGYPIPAIAEDANFQCAMSKLEQQFAYTYDELSKIVGPRVSLQDLFAERFKLFAHKMDAATSAVELCNHHEKIQERKSALGKRPWFDRIGEDRIYIRHPYRLARRDPQPTRYVHDYRGWPIRRFWRDLAI